MPCYPVRQLILILRLPAIHLHYNKQANIIHNIIIIQTSQHTIIFGIYRWGACTVMKNPWTIWHMALWHLHYLEIVLSSWAELALFPFSPDEPMGCPDKPMERPDKQMGCQTGKVLFKVRKSHNGSRHVSAGQERSLKVTICQERLRKDWSR